MGELYDETAESWQVRITVGGVDYVSDAPLNEREAQIFANAVSKKDDVQNAEVEQL